MKHKWTACLLALMLEIVAATGCANTDEDVSARLNENGQEEQFIGEPEPVPEPEPEPVPEPVPEPEPEPEPVPTVTAEPTPAKTQYVRITAEGVNLRSGAGTGYSVLGKAEKNTLFAVVGEKSGWFETYYRGRKAFVSARYCSRYEAERADDDTERVIEEGMKQMGVPYVYGAVRLHDGAGRFLQGFTAQKFDCSSLMQYIFYYGKGALLTLTTRTQVLQGKAVSNGAYKRGDLLFFTNASRVYNSGIERVGHVALYLGDGYILHTASDYAKAEKLTGARLNYLICARRI